MKSHLSIPSLSLLKCGILSALLAAGSVQAQVFYETDFTGSNGSTPTDWLYVTDPFEQMNIQSNTFRVVRPSSETAPAIRSNAVFNGTDLFGADPYTWSDYTVVTRLQGTNFNVTANGLLQGVIARFGGGSEGGYTATIQAGRIEIYTNPVESSLQNQAGTRIAHEDLDVGLENNTWYWLVFSLEGDQLTATAYNDNSGVMGNSIGSVSVTDATFTEGTAGIRVGLTGTNQRSVSYDSFSVIAIPEPHVYASAFGLLVLGLAFFRKSQQR